MLSERMRKTSISLLLLLSPSHSQDPTTAGPAPVQFTSGYGFSREETLYPAVLRTIQAQRYEDELLCWYTRLQTVGGAAVRGLRASAAAAPLPQRPLECEPRPRFPVEVSEQRRALCEASRSHARCPGVRKLRELARERAGIRNSCSAASVRNRVPPEGVHAPRPGGWRAARRGLS